MPARTLLTLGDRTTPPDTLATGRHSEIKMQTWPAQDAKGRFNELLEACMAKGPQMVTKRGVEAAVLVPVDQWRRLQTAAGPTLKELLLSNHARVDFLIPANGIARRRITSASG